MQSLVLLDFDGTLFNTSAFTKEMAGIFNHYGGLDFFATFPRNKFGTYSLKDHLLLVPTKSKRKAVKRQLKSLFLRCSQFVFDDTAEFLELLKQNPQNVAILVTVGEKEYQEKKLYLALASLRCLIDKIRVVEAETKVALIREVIDSYKNDGIYFDQIFFLDDKPQELAAAKTVDPHIKTILIDRCSSTHKHEEANFDFLIHDLREAIKIIRPDG